MRYVSWAAFYEGNSDALYLDVLLPRLIRDLVAREGVQLVDVPDVPAVKLGTTGRSVERIAEEACAFREAYDVLFIHADTGGRALERKIEERADAYCAAIMKLCDLPIGRCITITPRHEIEAWVLSDGRAVTGALGYNGDPKEIGLPSDAHAAERETDPKQVLRAAIDTVAGRRRAQRIEWIFPAVAQRQRLELLRNSPSFVIFEDRLRTCLREMGCIQ